MEEERRGLHSPLKHTIDPYLHSTPSASAARLDLRADCHTEKKTPLYVRSPLSRPFCKHAALSTSFVEVENDDVIALELAQEALIIVSFRFGFPTFVIGVENNWKGPM